MSGAPADGRHGPGAGPSQAGPIPSGDRLTYPSAEGPHFIGCPSCGLACRLADGALVAADAPTPHCPRCDEPLHALKRARPTLATQRSWALLLASALAYLPANLLPIMSTTSALAHERHTILGGIAELWRADAWVLAAIVFIASVAVPLL